ncbi:MAG: tetratricopeptide repeat protein, partial [Planctomycetota bacterium]
RRCLEIRQRELGTDDASVADAMSDLAFLYVMQGRYSEAEPLYRRSMAIREARLGQQHDAFADSLSTLGALYRSQSRFAEAEPLMKRSLSVYEQRLGPDHPDVGTALLNLGSLYYDLERYEEAESLYQRSLSVYRSAFGSEHPDVADVLNNLAVLYEKQHRREDAALLYQECLGIWQNCFGQKHPAVALALGNLAWVYKDLGRSDVAEPLVDQAIAIRDGAGVSPAERGDAYLLRAMLAWDRGDRGDALADLRQAMNLAEQQRGEFSGGEHQRAEAFSSLLAPFEKMVEWQREQGDLSSAIAAIERARARSLLDELQLAGADLQAGRSQVEREQLRDQERALQARIAELEKQLASSTAAEQDANQL